ncbi:MAG: glycoside hydrolase family 25 protein [Chitinophagaceae bacterium]|nr:MAG: glycoside hydrolase family 25 protein [Chitinophagaceae bacterium]
MPPRRNRRSTAKRNVYLQRFAVLLLVLVVGTMGWLFWFWRGEERAEMVRYPEFGIPMPTNYGIHGIDVSRYQSKISWEAVQAMEIDGIRLGFVFIKATEGVSSVDPQFKRNWTKSRDAGMIRGAYHFFLPQRSGRVQAEHFKKTVPLESGDLPPVVDIESRGNVKPEVLRRELQAWLDNIEKYYGVRPVIYTYLDFYKKNLAGHFDDYPLWVAHYLQPGQPRIERPWSFWQHSESGRVDGITSRVDFNVFSGDSLAFRALLVP